MNQPQLGSFESVTLATIRPSRTNPRKNFDELAMAELTRSVEENGVIQAILLRPVPQYGKTKTIGSTWQIFKLDADGKPLPHPTDIFNKVGMFENVDVNEVDAQKRLDELNAEDPAYEIVTGERRWRAAKAAGLTGIPANIREMSDAEAMDLQMVENLQRADLHPVEEAEGYRVLMSHGATAEDVAKKSGKSVGHVQRIVKLLSLEVDAKQLFADGHLTLDHALLLARLTPKDQERALREMLSGHGDWSKDSISHLIERRLDNLQNNSYVRGKRLIDMTAAQLKAWIEKNVLLQLFNAPWHLHDATLLPIAGACTDCPKRTGANTTLFADISTEDDVCTDPACFGEKQAAQQKRQMAAAKESGKTLLKISAAASNARLEAKPVQVVKGSTEVVTKKKVMAGQWVPAKEGECNSTIEALVVDGAEKGTVRFVCPDQDCKVHKHTVYATTAPARTAAPGKSAAQQEADAAKLKRYQEREGYVRICVFRAILGQYNIDTLPLLRRMVKELVDSEWSADSFAVLQALDEPVTKSRIDAETAIENMIEKSRDEERLFSLAFLFANNELLSNLGNETAMAADRLRLDKLAKVNGLKEGIKRFAKDAEAAWDIDHPAEPAAAAAEKKAPAKKAAAKKTALSPADRKRIADAQKKRWAEARAKTKKPEPAAETVGA